MKHIKPYNNPDNKKKQITNMFDSIAKTYDVLNLVLSFGMDYVWRKTAIRKITNSPKTILDIGTGTADLAILAAQLTNAQITGIDLSKTMINLGRKKIKKKKLSKRILLKIADAQHLPFQNNSFSAITAGFSVRNFENIEVGLSEIYRVLEKGGSFIILEPSEPSIFPLKQLYNIYFRHILPVLGKLISREKSAYKYFIKSVDTFPSNKKFLENLKKTGFKDCKYQTLTLGIVTLYHAVK